MQETGDRRQDAGIRKTENGKRKTNERKTIVIKLKNHNSAPDHRTDSPSQRGPGGVVTELVECVGCYRSENRMTNYLENPNPALDHRTDSPSQRGPGGVVTELVECVGCSFLIPHSSFIILSGCVGCSISIHQ
jgi:hypothetical protein